MENVKKILKRMKWKFYKKNTTVTVDNDGMVSKRKYFLPHNWVVRGGCAHYAALFRCLRNNFQMKLKNHLKQSIVLQKDEMDPYDYVSFIEGRSM